MKYRVDFQNAEKIYLEKEAYMPEKKQLVQKINDNITRLSLGFVSVYVFRDDSNAICIDTGINPKKLQAAFAGMKFDANDVDAVFLTHSDRDHIGGLTAFPKVKVFISSEEEQMMDGETVRFFKFVHNKKPQCELTYVKDGETVSIGKITVKAISTPGHTLGSMSFIIDGKYLFVGDALNLKDSKAVMDRGLLQMDKSLQEASIRKLAKLEGISMLFTAHTGFTDDFGKAVNEWR
ncbi:MAG: MBL fold metallo-hydrolase [Candidatus Kryptoniota bacterium]